MKLKYTLLICAFGLIAAAYLRDVQLAFFVLFGFCVLYSMRCIELQIGDLKQIPSGSTEEEIQGYISN
jgi:hypothetical protein